MATQPSSTIRPTARSGVFYGERKPRSTRYRTSARTGQKKEVQKKIFNGDRCAKESPIYIAAPRHDSTPVRDSRGRGAERAGKRTRQQKRGRIDGGDSEPHQMG